MSRSPFLFRWTPAWLKRRLRETIEAHARRLHDRVVSHSPFVDGKHLPIAPEAEKYLLPILEREDAASPDGMPIPPEYLWWGYAKTAERYLEIGKINIEKMRTILSAAGCDVRPGERVLDFGCAAGPQIRRLREFAQTGQVWGVDISAPHVAWCQMCLPTEFRFAVTSAAPHLPFEDRHFDLIYCGSVFSHISDMADAWLLELARVLRPGGRLYLTMNTKQSMYAYLQNWPGVEFSREVRRLLTDEEWKSNFGEAVIGRSVWQHSVYDLRVFQRKCEQAFFRLVSVNRNTYSYQTALLLERLETARRSGESAARPEVVVRSGTVPVL